MNTKRIDEVLAASILKLIVKDPQAAFDAILNLIRENKELKKELKKLKG